MKKTTTLLMALTLCSAAFAQTKTGNLPPALNAVKEADIKKDIFELASDAFRGRRAGTLDELRAAVWVAQRAQEAGLKPAGEDGTYFQFYNIHRIRVADKAEIKINDRQLNLWKEVWVTAPVESHIEANIKWLNSMADTTGDLQGKVVAVRIAAPKPVPAPGMSLWGYRYTISALRQQGAVLRRKGAAAVILVADNTVEAALAFSGHNYQEGLYQVDGVYPAPGTAVNNLKPVPVLLVREEFGSLLGQDNARLVLNTQVESFQYPSVNVVAKVNGTDSKLRSEYVLFSGHHDHDGVGNPIDRDSIWNGADDNASVTVGMLAIARAWASKPGKRSALFVWHGAEERGLLGSRWYAKHPTVDQHSIVAVLNGDMIGRNNPDSAALLGTLPPHKNSQQLVDMAMKANAELTHFKVDFSWDDPKHPEGWYFRSDHLPYAQAGIPAIFFTTLLHPDYHTPKDEPDRIDIAKLTRMAKWMYATGWIVSQTEQRPALDAK